MFTMKSRIVVVALGALLSPVFAAVQCPGTFTPITANDWIKKIDPGWNLGNTLDAVPNEGSWNNPAVTPDTFDDVKKAGFKSVRLPITWTTKIGPAPDFKINDAWLERVATVTKQVTDRGLYAIVNVHHDSWEWFDWSGNANKKDLEAKFVKVWTQIATKLACTSSLVAFEPINEPKGTTKAQGDFMNRVNEVFLKAINDVGGFNPQRVVTLVGLGEDSIKTSQFFKKPPGSWKNPWAIQYHYYSPYDFVFSAWGKTIWGSNEDLTAMETDLKLIRNNFTDVPLVIGEYAASAASTESAARWKWFDHFIRMAAKYNTATILWDNGGDFLDRKSHQWRDETVMEIIVNAQKGVKNSLADSTVDDKADTQFTSAYIFHKVGAEVADQSLPFLLNGNTVKKITASDGSALSTPADYTVSAGNGKANIVFTKAFLAKHISSSAPAGIKTTLTIQFSAGASARVQIVQWSVPQLQGGAKSSKAVAGKDLEIPIAWKGLPRVAAVKATFNDGEFMADDWTKYKGKLQAGYATYNNHWKWDEKNIIITKDAMGIVAQKKKPATFTFEFFPRVPGNSINYTLTV
ncbi:glycoside hydrolase [Microthyrium microscopicum]|uniref:Glycoside hydrolase n=1 Tax=Microthyrium microscopicum TaxID=703497 RepID=A0A6A6UTW4_9PEZI|nr:glycoside hydrolase [Microthyrium microscopicum]